MGRLQQRGLVSYEAPRWFNSPDWKLTFTTFYDNTVDVTTFTSERLEGSVAARQTLSKAASMDYRFTYRRVLASNLVISSNQVPLLSQPVRVGMPGVSYIQDTRDNPLETTRGNYTTLDTGSGLRVFRVGDRLRPFPGAELHLLRLWQEPGPGTQICLRPIDHALGWKCRSRNTVYVRPGEAFPADSAVKPIPLPELFLTGGGNSHRGFGLNQAGPRDPNTGFPIGGSALFLNNLELRMPPVTLPFFQDNISFAIFHDAGNVFVNSHDMIHNLLRWSQKDPQLCLQESTRTQCDYSYISHAIGIGVHYKTPIGPVRFDFGYNLNPPAFPSLQTTADPNNPGQTITTFVPQHARHFNVFFSIGQTF